MMHTSLRASVRAAGCCALALAALAASMPAQAGNHHKQYKHREHRSGGKGWVHDEEWRGADRRHHHRHDDGCARDHRGPAYAHRYHEPFPVPRHIRVAERQRYERYAHGVVYWEPHRHHHHEYWFPVTVAGALEYRPHYYCGGELVAHRPVRRGLYVEFGF